MDAHGETDESARRIQQLEYELNEQTQKCLAAERETLQFIHSDELKRLAIHEWKERLERLQAEHDNVLADLASRTAEVKDLKEEQQQLKKTVEASENAKLELHKDIGMMKLEVDRVREDNAGLNERIATVSTVENQLKEALLQLSVLQAHLRANEDERKTLECERHRLHIKERELEKLGSEFERLKAVSWQLINAMTDYRQQHQGVGMCVRLENNAILIKSLEEDGAAAHCDLRCGDVLLQINGRKLAGLSIERVQSLILGPAGTEVRVTARSGSTGDKYTASLLRGFAKNVDKSVVEEAEEACSAAMQLQRDLAASKACLDTVCTHHRLRYLDLARLLASVVRMVKESGRDGVAFGRDGLAEVLLLLAKGNGQVSAQETPLSPHASSCEDEACGESAKSEKSSGPENSLYLSVDPDIFQRALDVEQQECNRILESVLKAVHQLLNKYQQHARNTTEVKNKEGEVCQLTTTLQHLNTQLEQTQTQKSELARKLEMRNLKLKSITGEKVQLDKVILDLTRKSTSSAARVKDLEKERDNLMSELSETDTAYRMSVLKEQRLQSERDTLEMQISAVRNELASVTCGLGRLITTVCSPTTGVAGVGMKVKCDDRSAVCSVKAITPGGAADCCGRMAVGDTILSVNGESVHSMTAVEVQELFQGALGSEVCISAQKNQNDSSLYSVTMVRSLPGVQQRKIPISEQTLEAIRLAEALHEHVRELHSCRREELRERQHLDAQQKADTEKIDALESKISTLESALGDAREIAEQQKPLTALVQAERDVLQEHVAALTKELEERHTCRRGELDAVEERYKGLAEERDAAKSTVDFMAERQRQCEEEARWLGEVNAELQLEINTLTAQMETLQATLKLLKGQLEEMIEKEAIAVAKFTMCQQEAASMKRAIDEAKRHVADYERERLQSQQEIEQMEARCKDLSAQLFAKSSTQASNSHTVTPPLEAQTARDTVYAREEVSVGGTLIEREEAIVEGRAESIAEDAHSNPELPTDMKEKDAETRAAVQLPRTKAAAACAGGESGGGEKKRVVGAAKTSAGLEKDKRREISLQPGSRSKAAGYTKTQTPVSSPAVTGIGMVITEKAPHRVVSLVEGGAARACGEIHLDDILLAIDDANIERLPMTYIKSMLLGETGSKVRLLLGRSSGGEAFTVTLTRGVGLAKSFEKSKNLSSR